MINGFGSLSHARLMSSASIVATVLRMIIAVMACVVISTFLSTAHADNCYESMIKAPSPFMGNNDEIFVLTDGSVWQVKYEYEYLYEYYPTVTICPDREKLIVAGKVLNISPISPKAKSPATKVPRRPTGRDVVVIYKRGGCHDYFVADGPKGLYLLEWYGGYDPSEGDTLVGDLGGYGFKDVYYPNQDSKGRVYVDDYLLSQSSAAEKYAEKCD
jgi:hypothetical protein